METYTFSFQTKNNSILKEVKVEAIDRKHAFELRNYALANSRINDLKKIRVYLDK